MRLSGKKGIAGVMFVIAMIVFIAYSYRWTSTPHGKIDYLAAISLRLLSFTYHYKPEDRQDFEVPIPANGIFLISDVIPGERVARVEDVDIPGQGVDVQARIYWPDEHESGLLPIIVYFHGGGFVVGSVDVFDPLTRALANATGAIVVSVDYRLAPKHPYPAALDDCHAAVRWVADRGRSLGGDPGRIVVAGDSAGGNLAAAVALRARAEGAPSIAAQVLYYPALDLTDAQYDSKRKFSDGFGLSAVAMHLFETAYVGSTSASDPFVSPVHAHDLTGLPPALIVTAGFDPLTGAAQLYAKRLAGAGVPVEEVHYPTTIHGFMSVRLFAQRRQALEETAGFLQEVLRAH